MLNVFRRRLNYPELKRAVQEQARLYKANAILIEDKASGTQLIQELSREGLYVQGIAPEGDKVMRMHAQTALIEGGFVFLPKDAPWLVDYRQELGTFDKGKYDDQVDSTSQALAWFQGKKNDGLLEYYKIMLREEFEAGHLHRVQDETLKMLYGAQWEEARRRVWGY